MAVFIDSANLSGQIRDQKSRRIKISCRHNNSMWLSAHGFKHANLLTHLQAHPNHDDQHHCIIHRAHHPDSARHFDPWVPTGKDYLQLPAVFLDQQANHMHAADLVTRQFVLLMSFPTPYRSHKENRESTSFRLANQTTLSTCTMHNEKKTKAVASNRSLNLSMQQSVKHQTG